MKLATISNGAWRLLLESLFYFERSSLHALVLIYLLSPDPLLCASLCKLWCAASMRLRICWNSFQSAATSQAKCARLNAVLPRLIHSTIAPVMCGTTCTVLPKYFPSRSCSRTFYSRCTNTRADTLTYAWTILNIFADLCYETRSPS